MEDFLHLINLNQRRMARKYFTEKSHDDGFEAPRNSFELPVEIYESYDAVRGNVLDWSEKNFVPNEAPMKKLISEEITKRTKKKGNTPSVVARLMGVDMLPLDAKVEAQNFEKKKNNSTTNFPKEKHKKSMSVDHVDLFSSKSTRHAMYDSFHHENDRDFDEWNNSTKLNKPRRREHPQEEELQKFKRDFEAWQAARFKECAKVVELGKTSQWMAQESFNKEKMVQNTDFGQLIGEKAKELEAHVVKGHPPDSGDMQNLVNKTNVLSPEKRDSISSWSRRQSRDLDCSPVTVPDQKSSITSTPMKIVILRPGLDTIKDYEDSWDKFSGNTEDRDNMEDFLEEVKERLKYELQGKTSKRGTMVRGGGIETPYSEKPSDPKQIAQSIAKQVRESVTRDLGVNLIRSESTRSYKSEFQYNGTSSPEFISRDTRNFLSERLRNVLKRETYPNIPVIDEKSSSPSMLSNEIGRLQKSTDILISGNKMSNWGRVKNEQDMQSRSFRREPDDDIVHRQDLSPRNLIRSLSAPVSGTSFGKLLLEDRHILTGAHIRRKHEVIENAATKVKKQKKEKFNFKERVSSFKYGFILRGKLFSRKIQSAEQLDTNRHNFVNDIMSGPTVMMNFCDRNENSTEVPPSPASVCSSGYDEFWKPAEYQSSTSDLHPLEENVLPNAFREITSNLNELRRKLNQLDGTDSKEIMIEEQPSETEMIDLEDQTEAYIRDLLVASGLYDGSSDKSLSRWDPFAKVITNSIFEDVEETYRKRTKDNDNEESMDQVDKKIDHKLLLDLSNETLSAVLGPPVTMSKFMKPANGTMLRPPYGKKLLNLVWDIMRPYIYPLKDKSCCTLEGMVARDLQSTPWSGLINDDVDAVGKEMENWIVGDLIEEIVKEIQPS